MFLVKKCTGCQKAFRHFAYYEVNTCTNEKLQFCSACCQSKVTNHQDICLCWEPQNRYVFCELCCIDLSRNRLHVHTRNFGEWHSCLVCSCYSPMPRQPCRCKFPVLGPRYGCNTCGVKFLLMSQLQSHVCQQHPGDECFACPICQVKFSYKESLASHMRAHTSKTYVCDVCEKSFYKKDQLFTHYRTHTGDRPYSCDICGKIFCRRDHLVAHYRAHSGEKPFKCHLCNKEFIRKSSLYPHLKRHFCETSYSCGKCQKTFSSKSMLDKHNQVSIGTYKCNECCKKFNTKKRFDNHLKMHSLECYIETEIVVETEIVDLTID